MQLLKITRATVRFCGRSVRTTCQSVVLLVILLCVLEVGVRLFESSVESGESLVRPSWTSGQTLRRLAQLKTVVGDRTVALETNSLGLRGGEPVMPKPADVLRVVCLGDERVLAARVPREQTFCHRLQQTLQKRTGRRVEVINAGGPGDCPLLSLLRVRHDLLALDADLWLLTFDMTDVSDDYRLRPRLIADRDGRPLACPHPSLVNGQPNRWQQLCERFRLIDWGSRELGRLWTQTLVESPSVDPGSLQGQYAWLSDPQPHWAMHIKQALDPIARLRVLCGGRLAVAVCPAPWQVGRSETRKSEVLARLGIPRDSMFTSDAPFRVVGEFARQNGIPLCELSEGFRGAAEQVTLFQSDRAELSPAGHELMARLLADQLGGEELAWWAEPDDGSAVRPAAAERRAGPR